MLDTHPRPSVNSTLGHAVTSACQAAVAALLAADTSEGEDSTVADSIVPAAPPRAPGIVPFLTVLVLAATLLFAWVGLRSL
jgi:hypothetical protein